MKRTIEMARSMCEWTHVAPSFFQDRRRERGGGEVLSREGRDCDHVRGERGAGEKI